MVCGMGKIRSKLPRRSCSSSKSMMIYRSSSLAEVSWACESVIIPMGNFFRSYLRMRLRWGLVSTPRYWLAWNS